MRKKKQKIEPGFAWDGDRWIYFVKYTIIPKGKYKNYIKIQIANGKIKRLHKTQIHRYPQIKNESEKKGK